MAFDLSHLAQTHIYEVFEEKLFGEVSMVNDILPTIKEDFLYSPVEHETLYTMNNVLQEVLISYASRGVHFCALPLFEYDNNGMSVSLKDIVYKRL